MANYNYADAYGYSALAAAVIFTIAYVPLGGFFILQSFKNPTYVHVILAIFCACKLPCPIDRVSTEHHVSPCHCIRDTRRSDRIRLGW